MNCQLWASAAFALVLAPGALSGRHDKEKDPSYFIEKWTQDHHSILCVKACLMCLWLFSIDASVTEHIYFNQEAQGRRWWSRWRKEWGKPRQPVPDTTLQQMCMLRWVHFDTFSFMQITFKYSVRTSQETHSVSITTTNRLCCLRNKRCLVWESYETHKYIVWEKCTVFLMLKKAVHIGTTAMKLRVHGFEFRWARLALVSYLSKPYHELNLS
jgi:hypothetical protein